MSVCGQQPAARIGSGYRQSFKFLRATKILRPARGTPHPLVGNVSVRLIDHGHVNLSYLVFPAWRRRGFATRACRLALAYAASELGAVRARVAMLDTNPASAGVARALGAVEVGTEPSEGGGTYRVFSLPLRPAASTHPDQPSHC